MARGSSGVPCPMVAQAGSAIEPGRMAYWPGDLDPATPPCDGSYGPVQDAGTCAEQAARGSAGLGRWLLSLSSGVVKVSCRCLVHLADHVLLMPMGSIVTSKRPWLIQQYPERPYCPRNGREDDRKKKEKQKKWLVFDVGLIRTDAPEGTRFLVLRIRPLCHHAS